MFIKQVEEQLDKMSQKEMKQWILTQAKLLNKQEQEDFLKTLTGRKKIIYMPDLKEIEAFCDKVENGAIYIEYETHYYEFDDDGRYMDDWKVWYNDPFRAMPFLNRVLCGCNGLMILDEYESAYSIYEKVSNLKFEIQEAEDSEDSPEEDMFTLVDADKEGMLSVEINNIASNWIRAFLRKGNRLNDKALADKLVKMFENPVCRKLTTDFLLEENISMDVFSDMENILNSDISEGESFIEKNYSDRKYHKEKHDFIRDVIRKKKLLLNIQRKCIHSETEESLSKTAILKTQWKQIMELLDTLQSERYQDDQWQIEEALKICKALCEQDKLQRENWEERKKVLYDIVRNHYYDKYGCYKSMKELSEKLCFSKEEFLAFADILNESPWYEKEAAYLYRQYGRGGKYAAYLEKNLGRDSKNYIDLMNYYEEHKNFKDARRVAEQALEKCRENLTKIFIYLLSDAKKSGDTERYKKLYSSAKRRKGADIGKIDYAIENRFR